jgi:hypothetical protein
MAGPFSAEVGPAPSTHRVSAVVALTTNGRPAATAS